MPKELLVLFHGGPKDGTERKQTIAATVYFPEITFYGWRWHEYRYRDDLGGKPWYAYFGAHTRHPIHGARKRATRPQERSKRSASPKPRTRR